VDIEKNLCRCNARQGSSSEVFEKRFERSKSGYLFCDEIDKLSQTSEVIQVSAFFWRFLDPEQGMLHF